MKKAKYILIGIIVTIVLLLIAAFFLPKEYSFRTENKIDASKSIVYNLLANQENRIQWDPIAYQEGVVLNESNNFESFGWSSGNNEEVLLKVKNLEKGASILLEKLIGDKTNPDVIQYHLEDIESNGITKAIVEYRGTTSWPMNLLNILTKRKQSQKIDFELAQLEKVAKDREVDRIYNGYKIVEEIVKDRNFIIRRDQVSNEALQQFYIQNLGVLYRSSQEAGLQMDGMNSKLYYSSELGSKTIDVAAAIPVIDEVNIDGAESEHIDTRSAIVVDYYGDYTKSVLAHDAIKAYMEDNKYVIDFPIIEEYVTDPVSEKDPNKWLTKITYYIVGK